MTIKMRPFSFAERQNAATPDSLERSGRLWLSERMHTFWRKTVRTPWRNARRSMRRALAAGSDAGIPVSVDTTTRLAVAPFAGRFPPPLTQCEVVAPCQYRSRLHPLSVNSTKDECVHYVDHTVHAPAMTLEHLTDQYWFPYFGLLVSRQGQVWRHSYLGTVSGRLPVEDQGDRRPAAARRRQGAPALRAAARAHSPNSRRTSAPRRLGPAELRPLSAATSFR